MNAAMTWGPVVLACMASAALVVALLGHLRVEGADGEAPRGLRRVYLTVGGLVVAAIALIEADLRLRGQRSSWSAGAPLLQELGPAFVVFAGMVLVSVGLRLEIAHAARTPVTFFHLAGLSVVCLWLGGPLPMSGGAAEAGPVHWLIALTPLPFHLVAGVTVIGAIRCGTIQRRWAFFLLLLTWWDANLLSCRWIIAC